MPAVKTDWKGLSRSGGGDTDTDGAFRIDGARRLRHFDDGTAKTVIGSEVIAGLDDDYGSDFIWDSRGAYAWVHVGSFCYTYKNTPNSSAGDATWNNPGQEVECVDDPAHGLKCSFAGGILPDRWHASSRSHHPRGVNAAFGDGHVAFIRNEVDQITWWRLSDIAGGHTIDGDY